MLCELNYELLKEFIFFVNFVLKFFSSVVIKKNRKKLLPISL